jgi:hypothetical protein
VKSPDIVLQTDYPPEACMQRLYEAIDIQQRALFSLSGYQGDRPVVGILHPPEFRLEKRRYWRNDFAPVLYGKMFTTGGGTRVEGYFDLRYHVRFFMRCWLALVGIFGVLSVLSLFFGSGPATRDSQMGYLVPPAMFLFGLLLPRIGSYLSLGDRGSLAEFLERTLVARKDISPVQERGWDSILKW